MKYTLSQITHLNAPYDTCSVMHYNAYAFSMNRKKTIKAKKRGECELGQRKGFSKMDVKKINTLYDCPGCPKTVLYLAKNAKINVRIMKYTAMNGRHRESV